MATTPCCGHWSTCHRHPQAVNNNDADPSHERHRKIRGTNVHLSPAANWLAWPWDGNIVCQFPSAVCRLPGGHGVTHLNESILYCDFPSTNSIWSVLHAIVTALLWGTVAPLTAKRREARLLENRHLIQVHINLEFEPILASGAKDLNLRAKPSLVRSV